MTADLNQQADSKESTYSTCGWSLSGSTIYYDFTTADPGAGGDLAAGGFIDLSKDKQVPQDEQFEAAMRAAIGAASVQSVRLKDKFTNEDDVVTGAT